MFARMVFSDKTRILDVACGTGLVTFNMVRLNVLGGYVVGLDLSPSMLRIANRKKHAARGRCDVDFVRAVGEFLPFRDGTLRYVTVGLALRNLGDKVAVFRESLRVLLQQGWFLSVDFVRPERVLVWRVFRFHIFYVIRPAVSLAHRTSEPERPLDQTPEPVQPRGHVLHEGGLARTQSAERRKLSLACGLYSDRTFASQNNGTPEVTCLLSRSF